MLKDITQMIPTIQGEGPKIGVPSLLIRFKNCNIQCPFCDTQWSNKHTKENFDYFDIDNIFKKYPNISNIMFTGGEPIMYINNIINILDYIINKSYYSKIKTVEIETNGTLLNSDIINKLLNSFNPTLFGFNFNISPKLGPECYKSCKSIDVIIEIYKNNFKNLHKFLNLCNFVFKIVYSLEWEEYIKRFLKDVKLDIPIYLMPKTPDFRNYDLHDGDELNFIYDFRDSYILTIEKCMEWGLNLSCREHVWVYTDSKNEQIEVHNE